MQNNYQISQPLEDATTLQMRSDHYFGRDCTLEPAIFDYRIVKY